MGITPEKLYQGNLFENENPNHDPLMKAIDFIQKKNGQSLIKIANQDLNKRWKMKQERLSKNYTTRMNEIIIVK